MDTTMTREYLCKEDEYSTTTLRKLLQHFNTHHDFQGKRTCSLCRRHMRRGGKKTHIKRYHINHLFRCHYCNHAVQRRSAMKKHQLLQHTIPEDSPFTRIETAYGRNIETISHNCTDEHCSTVEAMFQALHTPLIALLQRQLLIKQILRFSIIIYGKYNKYDNEGDIAETMIMPLRSSSSSVFLADKTRIRREVRKKESELIDRNETFVARGSGWVLESITKCNVEVAKIFFRGGCSSISYGMPTGKRKYITDVPTTRNQCFFHAVALGLLPSSTLSLSPTARAACTTNYITKYVKRGKLKNKAVELRQIRTFEGYNKSAKFGVNVFTFDGGELIPVYRTRFNDPGRKLINILLVTEHGKHHYVYINCLDRLAHTASNVRICSLCMNTFSTEDILLKHARNCSKSGFMKTEYPKQGDHVRFEPKLKTVLRGIIGFADFESSLRPITREENGQKYNCHSCLHNGPTTECSHSTADIHEQIPSTYSIVLIDMYNKVIFKKTHSSDSDLLRHFYNTLDYIQQTFVPLLDHHRHITVWADADEERFQNEHKCHICLGTFEPKGKFQKVRDHCHYSNNFIGAAHKSCNLLRRRDTNIPIFVHNLQNYDGHFLIKGMQYTTHAVSGLPYNMEKFRTITIGKLSFVDSYQMLSAPLAELVENVQKSEHSFPILKEMNLFNTEEQRSLLLRKGVYPYEWASSIQKLCDTTGFPPREVFSSRLTGTNISEEDHRHGQNVFDVFECKDMLQYCELYCELDTVLLAEVIITFRAMVLKQFKVDSARYISIPQLAFDCMLRTLTHPIELMSDPDMILMCEQNVRGGVSFVGERHVNTSTVHDFPSTLHYEQHVHDNLFYIDANNLYSVAQSAHMPIGDYEWASTQEIAHLQDHLLDISNDSTTGYILEVDLEYPSHLHETHDTLPLVATQREFTYDCISPYSKTCLDILRTASEAKRYFSRKLCTDFTPKEKYVVHYRNLQTYVTHGLLLRKIHRIIKFKQSDYLKRYIEICTAKRAAAKTPFEKMLYKLMMNSVYGKFLQDNRKHFDVKISTTQKSYEKLMASPFYKGHRIISENIVAFYLKRKKVILDRLYATGFSILELSKNHMNRAWYEFIQPILGATNVSIVLTDTDSFVIKVQNMSRKEVLDKLSPLMDFSNYPETHERYSENVRARPGYFKDENCGNYMVGIVGLKSKCYITKIQSRTRHDLTDMPVCKGVMKAARKKLSFNKYKACVTNIQSLKCTVTNIRAKKHELFTQEMNKIALSTFDDKRWLFECGVHTAAYGSSLISSSCHKCP